jgi:hypothetical protein
MAEYGAAALQSLASRYSPPPTLRTPVSPVHVVFGPEEAHLVCPVAHHSGRGTTPHATQTLLTQNGDRTVDGVLCVCVWGGGAGGQMKSEVGLSAVMCFLHVDGKITLLV